MKNLIFETRNTEIIEDYLFYIPKCGVNLGENLSRFTHISVYKIRNNRRLSILCIEMWGKFV